MSDIIQAKTRVSVPNKDFDLLEFLAKTHNLSKQKLKKIIDNGGLWVQESGRKRKRIRRVHSNIKSKNYDIELFYNPSIKFPDSENIKCVLSHKLYSIWFKPAGILSQGNNFGDKNCMLRFIERERSQESYLVHRLDKETAGLMLFAHSKEAAKYYSNIWKKEVEKKYTCLVMGDITNHSKETHFKIVNDIDKKEAISKIEVLNSNDSFSLLEVVLETGRHHQIRRHLNHIKYPIIGDPKYGRGNKNKAGMMLVASSLSFPCIQTKEVKTINVNKNVLPKLPIN